MPSEPATTGALRTASDYLGLDARQRYELISQRFPEWLLAEPIEFPRHHETYGWACLVERCEATLNGTQAKFLCDEHRKELRAARKLGNTEETFFANARPKSDQTLGWALTRKAPCKFCGPNREVYGLGQCRSHQSSNRKAEKRDDFKAEQWAAKQRALPPLPPCSIDSCVHDATLKMTVASSTRRVCSGHRQQWAGRPATAIYNTWQSWHDSSAVKASVTQYAAGGQLALAALPVELAREIRYAIYHHSTVARRSQWRPSGLRAVVADLARAEVTSLRDASVGELAATAAPSSHSRRILVALPRAAIGLTVSAATSKAEAWFDPLLVGGAPFHSTHGGGETRDKAWELTGISQTWLRDLLWDHLRDMALKPNGKRPGAGTISGRIRGVELLSHILHQQRPDHGTHLALLGRSDAQSVKDIWDTWFAHAIPLPVSPRHAANKPDEPLTEVSRHIFMSHIRAVLRDARDKQRTPESADSFIVGLPEYPMPRKAARPRPMAYGDFRTMVLPENLLLLDSLDPDDLGLSDIWLAQAFQGGRISENLTLALGCVGMVGDAQPYIWRDITKIGVIDYGMPCYLPVYQRLRSRQEITRKKLRTRYSAELSAMTPEQRSKRERQWDTAMPLFPRVVRNPDLKLAVTYSNFRNVWTQWFEDLGLTGVTTHQTRATLATSLLNNGAPAELVRQLLGHFSLDALGHYARYDDNSMRRHLNQVWAAGPGMNKPGTILLTPGKLNADSQAAAAARIDLSIVPVEHGLCRYGPVVGGQDCPFNKNCTTGPKGPCEHYVLTGADLSYWERKRDAAATFAEGAPNDAARDYILDQWKPWDEALAGLRQALDDLGLLEEAERLDLRTPEQDYFSAVFTAGWHVADLDSKPEAEIVDLRQPKGIDH